MTSQKATNKIKELSRQLAILAEVKELVEQLLVEAGIRINDYDIEGDIDIIELIIYHDNILDVLNDEQAAELTKDLVLLGADSVIDYTRISTYYL